MLFLGSVCNGKSDVMCILSNWCLISIVFSKLESVSGSGGFVNGIG